MIVANQCDAVLFLSDYTVKCQAVEAHQTPHYSVLFGSGVSNAPMQCRLFWIYDMPASNKKYLVYQNQPLDILNTDKIALFLN